MKFKKLLKDKKKGFALSRCEVGQGEWWGQVSLRSADLDLRAEAWKLELDKTDGITWDNNQCVKESIWEFTAKVCRQGGGHCWCGDQVGKYAMFHCSPGISWREDGELPKLLIRGLIRFRMIFLSAWTGGWKCQNWEKLRPNVDLLAWKVSKMPSHSPGVSWNTTSSGKAFLVIHSRFSIHCYFLQLPQQEVFHCRVPGILPASLSVPPEFSFWENAWFNCHLLWDIFSDQPSVFISCNCTFFISSKALITRHNFTFVPLHLHCPSSPICYLIPTGEALLLLSPTYPQFEHGTDNKKKSWVNKWIDRMSYKPWVLNKVLLKEWVGLWINEWPTPRNTCWQTGVDISFSSGSGTLALQQLTP